MPYHIGEKGSSGCKGFPVIKDSDGTVMGCHTSKAKAKKQLAALYIHEPEASKEKSMINDMTNAYAQIIKQEKQEDGTLLVYGKATDDALDIDQQICDPTWLDSAMPAWFKSGGNIREQHSNIAAGVAKEYEAKKDGHYIHALVVDPVSVKKVETGVLKGFSIGIKAPRIVRDTKAANGRIIDGQIVEISLVDRPANPNAKLMLAKSIEGEANLVQVEELVEQTEKGSKMEQIKQIAELAKSLTADKVKFDQAAFDTARKALAELIVVEAKEMSEEGHNEKDSIEELLDAVKHLFRWYEGEMAEGEVATPTIELAADPEEKPAEEADSTKNGGCDCGCDSCEQGDGCDSKACKCASDKSAEAEETPTEEVVEETATPEVVEEVKEDSVVESTDKTLLSDSVIADIIEKAVKSATESVKVEIESLKADKEAAIEKSVTLEQELAIAKSAAVNGGPKRTAVSKGTESNDSEIKAAAYRAKAAAATDPTLAKGYRQLADEILSKAATAQN